jgi:hypothetical protein
MAISETRVRPPEFIEAAGKTYLEDLSSAVGDFKGADLSKVYGAQNVAGLDPLQQRAIKELESGIGAYKPYIQDAAAATGPTGYQQFMSPYQQDVINQTLSEYDLQAQKGLGNICSKCYSLLVLLVVQEMGVAQSRIYVKQSDRNRAALQAQLLGQGFTQANQLAQNQFANQMNLAQQVPALQGQQVAGLTTLGGALQAQRQNELTANQQLNIQNLNQPLTAAQQYGSGVTQLIAGYPGKSIQEQTPNPSGLQSLISAGSGLAGIYRTLNPVKTA